MKSLFNTLFLILFLSNCTTEGQEIQNTSTTKTVEKVVFIPQNFADSLSLTAIEITKKNVVYTPNYVGIDYPMGDVSENFVMFVLHLI